MKYTESDDGKVVDGKVVVWLGRRPAGEVSGVPGDRDKEARKEATAAAAAQALEDAAQSGVPFCEECEAARRKRGEKQG